ncbi:MAG: hypothetical protein KGM49_00600 [Sphingomonadales bacterium]|nr:hypothetical protein [Sphingomonadales bacterium]
MASVSGGQRLEEALRATGAKIGKAREVRVGFLEGATYPDGTPVAMVAAIQNFGAPEAGIPPRPFFSDMVDAKSPGWGDQFGKVLKAAENDSALALERMGEGIAGQLREAIVDTNSPPLSPTTIKRKGSDKPLIDTGHMLASVDKEVT